MVESSVLLDALLEETEDEDEQTLSAAVGEFFQSGYHFGGATTRAERRDTTLDGLIDLVDGVTPSDESGPAGPITRVDKERKLSTRQREREEILRLREEEKELRKRLAELQMHKRNRLTGEDAAIGDADVAQSAQLQTRALWLRVAKSQLERRQNAHIENLKLRHMLSHQVKVMQGMQKMLRKRSTSSAEHWMSLRKRQCALTDADTIIFARLESDLDSRYLETDAVLRESGCADKKKEMQHARVKSHATRGMYIEFFDAKIMPFGFHDAGNATWNGLQSSEISLSDGVYTIVSASTNAVSAKLSIRLSGSQTEVLVDAKFVARKFSETDRVVVVWQCQSDTGGPLCGDRGVRLFNYGWTVISDVTDPTPDSQTGISPAPTAIIQTCARVTPELADDPQLSHESVGVLADLVTTSTLRNMNSHHQRTEDILVEGRVK